MEQDTRTQVDRRQAVLAGVLLGLEVVAPVGPPHPESEARTQAHGVVAEVYVNELGGVTLGVQVPNLYARSRGFTGHRRATRIVKVPALAVKRVRVPDIDEARARAGQVKGEGQVLVRADGRLLLVNGDGVTEVG